MLETPPTSEKIYSTQWPIVGKDLGVEYLDEFKLEFETALGCESGVSVGPIHDEETRGRKIPCYGPFKILRKYSPC
jgi:hypothetical protein